MITIILVLIISPPLMCLKIINQNQNDDNLQQFLYSLSNEPKVEDCNIAIINKNNDKSLENLAKLLHLNNKYLFIYLKSSRDLNTYIIFNL